MTFMNVYIVIILDLVEWGEAMNIQFKKGVVEICVLALVNRGDRYGYDLVQDISSYIHISEGTVYPLLRRLTKEGYFTTYLRESSEGPSRKYYAITKEGKHYLQLLMREWESFTKGVNDLLKEGM